MKGSVDMDTGSGVAQAVTHFRVPAREMLLDEPICCPLYGALSFDGLAVDGRDGAYLVVRTAAARAYLGPDAAVAARRAHILVVALVDGGHIGLDRAPGVAAWLGECWNSAVEEIRSSWERAETGVSRGADRASALAPGGTPAPRGLADLTGRPQSASA